MMKLSLYQLFTGTQLVLMHKKHGDVVVAAALGAINQLDENNRWQTYVDYELSGEDGHYYAPMQASRSTDYIPYNFELIGVL